MLIDEVHLSASELRYPKDCRDLLLLSKLFSWAWSGATDLIVDTVLFVRACIKLLVINLEMSMSYGLDKNTTTTPIKPFITFWLRWELNEGQSPSVCIKNFGEV